MTGDILTIPPTPADARLSYGPANPQFGDLRLPAAKGPHPVIVNIHGGFWRNKYDLVHAGHLCAALTAKGLATWNLEYRRVGDAGGGWPGSLRDVAEGYHFVVQLAETYRLDKTRVVVMGHSAGGHLALCLAGHESSISRVISLAGVVDLQSAWELHLSNDAVVDFLGDTPSHAGEHYKDADPMQLQIRNAKQWLVHGTQDAVVPVEFSRHYAEFKKQRGEDVQLVEIENAGHFEMIDPRSTAWPKIVETVMAALKS